jgi:hypothetical protein
MIGCEPLSNVPRNEGKFVRARHAASCHTLAVGVARYTAWGKASLRGFAKSLEHWSVAL